MGHSGRKGGEYHLRVEKTKDYVKTDDAKLFPVVYHNWMVSVTSIVIDSASNERGGLESVWTAAR